MTYTTVQFIAAILAMLISARICLHYIRINHILRQVCKSLISIDARHRGVTLTPEQVETELLEWMESREQLAAE